MGKAIFSFILVLVIGILGMAVGNDLLGGYPEFGTVIGIATAAGCIIFFQDRKRQDERK